jgi:hypothetical protein
MTEDYPTERPDYDGKPRELGEPEFVESPRITEEQRVNDIENAYKSSSGVESSHDPRNLQMLNEDRERLLKHLREIERADDPSVEQE